MPAGAASPGEPDEAPSDVPPDEAASVIVANYGDCRADRARLADLQDWIQQQGLAR